MTNLDSKTFESLDHQQCQHLIPIYVFSRLLVGGCKCIYAHGPTQVETNSKLSTRDTVKAGISNRDIYHVAELTVGSNKQKVSVRLDTLLNALCFPAPSCGELESDDLDRRILKRIS